MSESRFPLLALLASHPAFRKYIGIRAAEELASQMLNVAIGWYVYSATHDPMSLAYVGLVLFLPNIALVLVAGQAADRFDRGRIIALSLVAQTLSVATLGVLATTTQFSVGPVYAVLLVIGSARAFAFPAMSALLPRIVDRDTFPRAVASASSVFQVCAIAGPAVGGLVYGFSDTAMFVLATGLYVFSVAQAFLLPRTTGATVVRDGGTDRGLLGGIRYIFSNRLLLALISLDLFAVLLGGVTALLPIFAKDILEVGPFGLGWLRCAPGIGATVVGLFLAHRTIKRNAGKLMLGCVAGFGACTVAFALSTNLWLSLTALAALGGFDMVSMVIRQTLVQLSTPDAMRGRVSAVNWVFIGASNELGEFESGLTAALFGTVPAALLGGLGTLAVVLLWSGLFPELRRADRLVAHDGARTESSSQER
ncbi:MAG TPA: MFS transporter [Burkholderiales bacterium]|nr:MFS transporter [Burkholderiales bacterium]